MSKMSEKYYKTLEFAVGENADIDAFNDLKNIVALLGTDMEKTVEYGQNLFGGETLIIHDADIDPYDVALKMLAKHPDGMLVLIEETADFIDYDAWNLVPGKYTSGNIDGVIKENLGVATENRSIEEWKAEIEAM